jgi:hypothetical protein
MPRATSTAAVPGRPRPRRVACAAILALLPVAGCGGGGGNSLPKVSGTVTVDGAPADGCVLIFYPEGSRSASATGTADSAGKFTIVTNAKPGIAAGKYKVTANWPDPSQRATAEDLQKGISKDAPDLLGGRYMAPDRSPLTAEVTASTKELPAFQLTTK